MIHPLISSNPSPGSTATNVIEDLNTIIDCMSHPPPLIPIPSESSNPIFVLDSLVVDTFSVTIVSSFIVKCNLNDTPFIHLGASGSFVCPFCKEQAAQYHLDNFVPKKLEMYMRPPTNLLEDALSVMLVTSLRINICL